MIAASQEEALGAPRHGSTRATSSRLTSTEHLEEEQGEGQHVQMRDVSHEEQVATARYLNVAAAAPPPSFFFA